MANPQFSKLGPVYPLGKFTVAVVGTTQDLNTNVDIHDSSGVSTSQANQPPLKCTELKIMTPTANIGNIFLVKKGQTAAANAGAAVALVVQPGQERSLVLPSGNAFTLDQYTLDTDAAGSVCWATAIIT